MTVPVCDRMLAIAQSDFGGVAGGAFFDAMLGSPRRKTFMLRRSMIGPERLAVIRVAGKENWRLSRRGDAEAYDWRDRLHGFPTQALSCNAAAPALRPLMQRSDPRPSAPSAPNANRFVRP